VGRSVLFVYRGLADKSEHLRIITTLGAQKISTTTEFINPQNTPDDSISACATKHDAPTDVKTTYNAATTLEWTQRPSPRATSNALVASQRLKTGDPPPQEPMTLEAIRLDRMTNDHNSTAVSLNGDISEARASLTHIVVCEDGSVPAAPEYRVGHGMSVRIQLARVIPRHATSQR
jgi:hypothetical protein